MVMTLDLSTVMEESVEENRDDIENVLRNDAKCGTCAEICAEGSESLGCELCSKWFHRECLSYNKTTYKAIIQLDEVKWFCRECNSKAKDTMSMIQMVMTKLSVVEARNIALEMKNAALEKRVLIIETERKKEKEEAAKPPRFRSPEYTEESRRGWGDQQQHLEGQPVSLSEIITKEIREMKEIEEKKCNIIINDIPEIDSTREVELEKLTSIGVQNGDNVRSAVEKLFTKIEATGVEIKECIRIPNRRGVKKRTHQENY